MCPIPFYEIGTPPPADYSVPNFRAEQFKLSLEYWMPKKKSFYYQKWQSEDPVCIQFGLPTQGPGVISVDIVTCMGEQRVNIPLDQTFIAAGNFNNGTPVTVYQYKWKYGNLIYNAAPLPAGRYYVQITVNYGDVSKVYVSEPQEFAAVMPDTVPIDYNHDVNEYNTFFSLHPNFRIRVEGNLMWTGLKYNDTDYVDQIQIPDKLHSESTRQFELRIGVKGQRDSNPGVPKWLLDIIGKAFMCRYTSVKNRMYVRPNGEEIDIESRYPTDLHFGTLVLQEKEPDQTLTIGISELLVVAIPPAFPWAITPLTISNGATTVILAGGTAREITNNAGLTAYMGQLNSNPQLTGTFVIDSGNLYYRNGPQERFLTATGETYGKRMLFGITTVGGQLFRYQYSGGQHIAVFNANDIRVAISTTSLPPTALAQQVITNLPANSTANTLSIYHKDNISRLQFASPISNAYINSLPASYSNTMTHFLVEGHIALQQLSLPSLTSMADTLRELRMSNNSLSTIVGPGWNTGFNRKFANLTYVDFRFNQIPPTPGQETLLVDYVQNASYNHPGIWMMEGQGLGPATGLVVQNANFMTSAGWQVSYDL